ncbi:MAG: hypothetical protein ACT4P2_15840 [Pseudomonadota bacterium]
MKAIAAAVLTVALSAGVGDAQNCQFVGSQMFCDTGLSTRRIGPNTFYSDGTSSTRIGPTTYCNDGRVRSRIGNQVFGNCS